MLKKLILNQSGVSLAMAIVAAAVLGSGTYYIVEVARKNREIGARARTTSGIEQEKKRLSAILADNVNCSANFKGFNANTSTYTSLKYPLPSVVNFVSLGAQSFKLNLQSIETSYTAGQPKSGKLRLIYNAPTSAMVSVGKGGGSIEIPLYMNVDAGGTVQDCYAITENTNVNLAIEDACQTTTSYYNTVDGVVTSCFTSFNLNNSTADAATIDCSASATGPTIKGFDITAVSTSGDTGNMVSIPSTKCSLTATNGTTPNCGTYEFSYGFENGNILCAIPGAVSTKDTPACLTGQLLNKTSSTSALCVATTTCTGMNFINSISTGGLTCAISKTYTCPAGQYARGFDRTTGNPDCAPFPVLSGNCQPAGFAYAFSRNESTNSGSLLCRAYTKAKTCSGTNAFLNYFDASGGLVCTSI